MPLEAFSRDSVDKATKEKEQEFDQVRVSQLLQALSQKGGYKPLAEGSGITVHAAVSRFSVLYERIRNAVEYREDHLLRKGAIQRILKRQLVLEGDPHVIASHLIRELIGACYLPNGTLPESLVDDAAVCVRKYQAMARQRIGGERHLHWLLGVVSAELEELLTDPAREKALVSFLYERLVDRITVRGVELEPTERRLQIYVACYRSLVKADEESVGYKLLRAYLPEWLKPEEWLDAEQGIDEVRVVAERLLTIHERINDRLRHPLSQRFLRAIKPWAVALSLLQEAVLEEKERAELLTSPEDVHAAVEQVVQKREQSARTKLRRGTVRAMIYLFLTKMIFAFLLELPLEWYWFGEVSLFALGINLLLPPVIMFFVGMFIRLPGKENRQRIIRAIDDLLTKTGIALQEIKISRRRKGITLLFMRALYTLTFIFTFGVLWSLLLRLDFTWIATLIFFFFLCVVSFFGYRLRQIAREIVVVRPRERLLMTLLDFFTLPILRVGQRLSQAVSQLNIFIFLFDFLFEAPFKLFLNVLEDWLGFMREKKEALTDD